MLCADQGRLQLCPHRPARFLFAGPEMRAKTISKKAPQRSGASRPPLHGAKGRACASTVTSLPPSTGRPGFAAASLKASYRCATNCRVELADLSTPRPRPGSEAHSWEKKAKS